MGQRLVLALTGLLALCAADIPFPTDETLRDLTEAEARVFIDKVNYYRSNVPVIAGDMPYMVSNIFIFFRRGVLFTGERRLRVALKLLRLALVHRSIVSFWLNASVNFEE